MTIKLLSFAGIIRLNKSVKMVYGDTINQLTINHVTFLSHPVHVHAHVPAMPEKHCLSPEFNCSLLTLFLSFRQKVSFTRWKFSHGEKNRNWNACTCTGWVKKVTWLIVAMTLPMFVHVYNFDILIHSKYEINSYFRSDSW